MKHLWLNLLSFCCLSLAAAPLNMLSPAPAVDGKPGDPGWKNAGKFTYSKRKATAWVGRTATHLFVAVESGHGAIANKVNACTAHDSPVYSDDCLDLFLNTSGGKDYYQVIANVRGTIFDQYKDPDGRTFLSWDSGAKAAGSYGKDSFYIEMALPLASLDFSGGRRKLALAVGCYTKWDMNGESILGNYHQPETFTPFEIPDSYPVKVVSAVWPSYAGDQVCSFELKNLGGKTLDLAGEFNGKPVGMKLEPEQTRILKCVTRQTAGREKANTLILRSGGQEVVRLNRILIPKELLRVEPVSDLIYEGESLPLRIAINEKQTEPLLIRFSAGKIICTYKGIRKEIPYRTIPSPWNEPQKGDQQ